VNVEGNERLTAVTGAVLVVLLAALGVTILSIGPLIWWHVLLGILLIPPVLLKLASTGWRFLRYYTGRPEYVRRGPPVPALRLLAPLVVASTLVVFATGVALLVVGPGGGVILLLHKASFVIWLFATGVHVLAHLGRLLPTERVAGFRWRGLLLGLALGAGAALAVATVRYAHPWVHFLAGQSGDR
jgi:hypothetical protein